MKEKVDLHIHSRLSDGDFKTNEIIELLRQNKIKYFSICDHDNIMSYHLIKKMKLKDLNFISGVELSTYQGTKCFHILGYNYHGNINSLKKLLAKIRKNRIIRAKEMINKIESNNNIKFTKKEIKRIMHHHSIGKKHVAQIMIENNYGDSYLEIRNKFMTGLKLPTSYRVSVKEATTAILNSGGIPILAHPKEYELRYNIKIEDYIEDLIADGIKGIEVYHSIHNENDIKRYLKLAKKYNLLISAGSDFHGESHGKTKIGQISKEELQKYERISIIDQINC